MRGGRYWKTGNIFGHLSHHYLYSSASVTDLPPHGESWNPELSVARESVAVFLSFLIECGVNITQLAVLRCIARRSGEPLSRIAEELEMDRTSLYRAIAPMIRDGWLISAEHTEQRFRTARLTAKGKRLLADANGQWNDVQRQVVGRFGKAEYAALVSELYRLAECASAEK